MSRIKKLINYTLGRAGLRLSRIQGNDALMRYYPITERPIIPQYVNIGAGSFRHPFWHNLDIPNRFYAGVQCDGIHIAHDLNSMASFPIRSDSVDVFYISHVIEHLSNKVVAKCFSEVFRCLREGGYFRITSPDMEMQYLAYLRGDLTFWPQKSPWGTFSPYIEQRFLEHIATSRATTLAPEFGGKILNEEFRQIFRSMSMNEAYDYIVNGLSGVQLPEYHVNWFTSEKLKQALSNAGFCRVYDSRYMQSECALLRNGELFDGTCPELSLYVECQKK